ncbi:MAG TPA: trypsin-like peptidase domain-containing protein [Ktedonobacterales bacterium]
MSASFPPDQRFDGASEPETPTQPESPTYPPTYPGTPEQGGFPSGGSYQPSQPYQQYPQYQPYAPAPGYQPPVAPQRRTRLAPWLLGALALILVLAGVGVGLALSRGGASTPTRANVAQQPVATLPVAPAAQDLQQQIVNVIHTVQPAVVEVQSQSSQGQAIGSGEIVSSDGYIVTNDHVVTGFSQYAVLLSNGKTYPATLVGEAPQDDLAVLKVSTGTTLQTIAFGESNKADVGQFVVALGSPLGLQQSATFGIVSALDRTASEGSNGPAQELTGLIQTSAPINPGNSGGALVNLQGQLIGVPTLGAVDPNSGGSANGIGFAIPSDRVKFVMDQLIKNGHMVNTGQGFIGIQGEDVTSQIASSYNLGAQSGVLIIGFAQAANGASPAQQAGLKSGDIITAVNDQTVSDNNDLASALLTKQPGTQVKITYVRGNSTGSVTVTLGERPTNAG